MACHSCSVLDCLDLWPSGYQDDHVARRILVAVDFQRRLDSTMRQPLVCRGHPSFEPRQEKSSHVGYLCVQQARNLELVKFASSVSACLAEHHSFVACSGAFVLRERRPGPSPVACVGDSSLFAAALLLLAPAAWPLPAPLDAPFSERLDASFLLAPSVSSAHMLP